MNAPLFPFLRQAVLCIGIVVACGSWAAAAEPMTLLIVDGQNNHGNWPETTQIMKAALEESGLFSVTVVTHGPNGEDPSFAPDFTAYDVVLSNFGHGGSLERIDTQGF